MTIKLFLRNKINQGPDKEYWYAVKPTVEFANQLIFSYENCGNPAGDLIQSSDDVINNLFK